MSKIFNILICFFILFGSNFVLAITEDQVPIKPCSINRIDQRKCKISLCAMFQNESEYLKEWIEFHRIVGVSHFYLYNNNSTDGFWNVLKPYIEQGVVELFDVPFDSSVIHDGAKTHNVVQVACYNHALKQAKKAESTWLAIIDSDEYICPTNKDLSSTLNKYKKYPGLVIFWQMYGTSNVWSLNPGELLTEKLTMKFPQEYGENYLYKSIVKPKYATCLDPHICKYSKGHAVYPNFSRFHHGPRFNPLPVDVIRLNHYTFRTESFYQNVKKPRRAAWGYVPSPAEEKLRMDWGNSIYDPIMLKFAPELHKRMN